MTCRGADQIMLMYVARSMNLWASTDMRLTISPTVDDFLAELVITRAWRQRRGKEGERGRRQPSALPSRPTWRKETAQQSRGHSLLFSPLLAAYLPSQPMCLITKPTLLSTALTASPSWALQYGRDLRGRLNQGFTHLRVYAPPGSLLRCSF